MLRKFIVRNFVLLRHFRIAGKDVTVLRCVRFGLPIFILFMASLYAYVTAGIDPAKYAVFISLGLIALYVWLTFSSFKFSYFDLWPVKREELDAEQQKDYDTLNNTFKGK